MINENDDQNTSRNEPTPTDVAPKRRGFAAMDPALVSELAKRGGMAHRFTSDEARLAGRKGGMATHAKRTMTGTPPKSS
jgi:general stress protein YciG